MDPKVTLIISTYNRCAILRETLEAVAGLREDVPHEVLVVNDGSRDGTSELLHAWAQSSARHHVLAQPNSGALRARNNGAQAATTEFLIFMDDDIRPAPDFVRAHLEALAGHPDCWITGPVPDRVPDAPTAWSRYRAGAVQGWEAALPQGPARDAGWMTAANVSVRREEFDRLGGFDDTLTMGGEDLDLMLRAHDEGIHLWFDPSVAAEHHDSFLTLRSFCQRQELYNESVVSVWRRHGHRSGLDHRIERNRPPDLGSDGLSGGIVRIARGLVASRLGLTVVHTAAAAGHRLGVFERLQFRLFDVAVGGAICRGIRRGLRA